MNNNMVTKVLCLALMVAVASAAVAIGRIPPTPKELAHKKGCYVREINDVIPFGGETSPVGICMRIECGKNLMHYATCGSVGTGDLDHCYISDIDYSRPYPECCPTIVCDIENNRI